MQMLTMADTAPGDTGPAPVARASVPAAEYAGYRAFRDRFGPEVLGPLGPAIRASTLATLDGLPYPVRFRNQGALEEWRRLFGAHDWSRRIWDAWATAPATCLDCINELCWQVDRQLDRHPRSQRPAAAPEATFATVVRWAANIHFERKRGALIETTPALDTLLMQSDIDGTLPMQLFSPPYDAQYLRLNRATAEHFRTDGDRAGGRWIDGVFCFVSRPDPSGNRSGFITVMELVVVYATDDRGISAQLLRGPVLAPDETVNRWAEAILTGQDGLRTAHDDVLMKLVNSMVKVFLYLGLKEARKEINAEHSAALGRLAGVGPKKQGKTAASPGLPVRPHHGRPRGRTALPAGVRHGHYQGTALATRTFPRPAVWPGAQFTQADLRRPGPDPCRAAGRPGTATESLRADGRPGPALTCGTQRRRRSGRSACRIHGRWQTGPPPRTFQERA